MKTTILILAFISSLISFGQSETLSTISGKYSGKKGFSKIAMTQDMFKAFSNIKMENADSSKMLSMIQNMNEIMMLRKEKDKKLKFYSEVKNQLKLESYKLMIDLDTDGEKIESYAIEKDAVIEKVLILMNNDGETIIIYVDGKIDLEMMSKFASKMNMKGMEKGFSMMKK